MSLPFRLNPQERALGHGAALPPPWHCDTPHPPFLIGAYTAMRAPTCMMLKTGRSVRRPERVGGGRATNRSPSGPCEGFVPGVWLKDGGVTGPIIGPFNVLECGAP